MTVLLLGGGGHASDVISVIEALSTETSVVVADDREIDSERFAGRVQQLRRMSMEEGLALEIPYIASVGYPSTRRRLVERALAADLQPAGPLIHPDAMETSGVSIGSGSVVMGHSWLSPDVHIGAHVYVGYGAKVGHDTTVGLGSSLMPGSFVGGECEVGDWALIGANATVLQGTSIGTGATVGAGAVVLENVQPGATVVGNPARRVD